MAVTKPIVYSKHNNNYRVSLTIALAWILSFVIALPIACGLNNVADRQTNMCALFNPEYIITSSIGSFYIPCGIMIILYYRVFHTIRGRTKYITFTSNSTMKPLNKSAHIIKLCTDVAVVSRDVNANESISPMMKPYNESLSPSCSLDGCESNFSVTVTDSFPTSSKDSCAPIPHLDQPRQVPMLENTSFIYTNQNAVVHHAAAEPNGTNSISTDTDTIRTYGTDKEFKDMDQFRKHLKNRIRQAKRCSLSVFPVQYSTVSGQQIYSMGKPSRRAPLSVRVSDSVRKKLTATRSFITKGSLTSRCGDNRELNGNNGHFKTLFRNKGLNLTNTSNQVMSKDRTSAKLERKATKTLAIVLGKSFVTHKINRLISKYRYLCIVIWRTISKLVCDKIAAKQNGFIMANIKSTVRHRIHVFLRSGLQVTSKMCIRAKGFAYLSSISWLDWWKGPRECWFQRRPLHQLNNSLQSKKKHFFQKSIDFVQHFERTWGNKTNA